MYTRAVAGSDQLPLNAALRLVDTAPNKVDQRRVDHGDYIRAGGDVTCSACGFLYYDHPIVVGFSWLHRICDGRLVKL